MDNIILEKIIQESEDNPELKEAHRERNKMAEEAKITAEDKKVDNQASNKLKSTIDSAITKHNARQTWEEIRSAAIKAEKGNRRAL